MYTHSVGRSFLSYQLIDSVRLGTFLPLHMLSKSKKISLFKYREKKIVHTIYRRSINEGIHLHIVPFGIL